MATVVTFHTPRDLENYLNENKIIFQECILTHSHAAKGTIPGFGTYTLVHN